MIKRLTLAGLALFALAGLADAQSCRSRGSYSSYGSSYGGYSYTPSYSYPSYSYPSYSYSPPVTYSTAPAVTYSAPLAAVVKKEYKDNYKDEIFFQKFVAVLPLAELPTYSAVYSPPPAAAAQQQQNVQAAQAQPNSQLQQMMSQQTKILEALQTLDLSVKRLEGRVETLERAGRFAAPPQPAPLPKDKEKEKYEQGPAPKEEPKNGNGNGKITAQVVNQQKCAACHQKGNESYGGDFILTDEKGAFVALTDKQLRSMGRALAKGTMPKLGKRATEAGITTALTKEEAEALYAELDRQIQLESK